MGVPRSPELAEIVAGLDELVRGDGARFTLAGADEVAGGERVVRLALVVEDASCADCIVARPMLESIALKRLRAAGVPVTAVVVDDPRER